MVRLFLVGNPIALILLPLLIVGYDCLWVYNSPEPIDNSFGLLGTIQIQYYLSIILANSMVFVNALSINRLFNTNSFLEKNTYMPSLVYVIACSFFDLLYCMSSFVIAHFLMINLLNQFLKISQNEQDKSYLFNAFFLFGLCLYFIPDFVVVLPILLLNLSRYNIFKLKDFVIVFVGILIPIIYLLAYRFILFNDWDLFNWFEISFHFSYKKVKLFFISIFLFLLSLFTVIGVLKNSNINLKRKLESTLMYGLILILFCLFADFSGIYDQNISLFYIPFSVLLTFTFVRKSFALPASSAFYLIILFSLLKFFII